MVKKSILRMEIDKYDKNITKLSKYLDLVQNIPNIQTSRTCSWTRGQKWPKNTENGILNIHDENHQVFPGCQIEKLIE